jgi:hypothetical protein
MVIRSIITTARCGWRCGAAATPPATACSSCWATTWARNPLKYTDPSGHAARRPMHDYDENRTGSSPAWFNILTTNVSLYMVRRPTDLEGRTGLETQFINLPKGSETRRYNLCGDLSFSTIYETVTRQQNTLEMIWLARGGGDSLTDTSDWRNVANQFGWSAEVVWLDWRDPFSQVSDLLANGAFLMVCGSLDATTGRMVSSAHPGGVGHWVVIARASQYGVYLYNPFTNSYQYYTWKEFTDTDGATLIITPPPVLPLSPPSSSRPNAF